MSSETFMSDELGIDIAIGSNGKPIFCRRCGMNKVRCPGCKRIVCGCSPMEPRLHRTGHLVASTWITCIKG